MLLADENRSPDVTRMAHAIAHRHEVDLSTDASLFRALTVARRAHGFRPHLVHAVGASRGAQPARVVARGLGIPLVLSLMWTDLERPASRSRALAWVREAAAVLVDEGRLAEALRNAGVTREIYVLAAPEAPEHEPLFLGALEVIYGRVLAGTELDGDAPSHTHEDTVGAEPRLIQIGRPRGI